MNKRYGVALAAGNAGIRGTDKGPSRPWYAPPDGAGRKGPRGSGASGSTFVLAAYCFLVLARISDGLPALHLPLVTAGVLVVFAIMAPHVTIGRVLRTPETRAVLALLALAVL